MNIIVYEIIIAAFQKKPAVKLLKPNRSIVWATDCSFITGCIRVHSVNLIERHLKG